MVSDGNSLAIRIDQDFLRIEALAGCRVMRAICAIAIQLSLLDVGQKNMPVMRGSIADGIEGDSAGSGSVIRMLKQ
jgi:hypothetical protein